MEFATAGEFLPTVRKAGLEGVPAGLDVGAAFRAARGDGSRRGSQAGEGDYWALATRVFGVDIPRRYIADLLQVIGRGRPDLVVYETFNPGGAIAAKLAGIPSLGHSFGRIDEDMPINGSSVLLAEYGLDQMPPPLYGDAFVDICPSSAQTPVFRAAADRVPLRPVGWSEPGELPAGVAGRECGRPLIYLTLGTINDSPKVLRTAIDGLAALEADVLVAAGPVMRVADLGEIPANVRVENWMPQSALMPHLDLMVHHGGSGSTLGAFAAGLPQLILPQGADQFSNADVVHGLGVGERLAGAEVTADAVTEWARQLLVDEAVRAAAGEMAEEVAAMPEPKELAARLHEFAV